MDFFVRCVAPLRRRRKAEGAGRAYCPANPDNAVAALQGRNPKGRALARRDTALHALTGQSARHGGVRLVSHRARTLRTHENVHNTLHRPVVLRDR